LFLCLLPAAAGAGERIGRLSPEERDGAGLQARILAARRAPAGEPKRIVLRAGRYLLSEALLLTALDSGLTIESEAGGRAELCGGRRITEWRSEKGTPLWVARVPRLGSQSWDFRVLVVDGRVAERSRLPEQGFFQAADPRFDPDHETAAPERLSVLHYRAGDLSAALDLHSAEVRVQRIWDESLSPIAANDAPQRALHLSLPLRYPPGAYARHEFEILNLRAGLTHPGEWYLDVSDGRVYYWPKPGETVDTVDIWAPVTETLIRIDGANGRVQGVTLRNLDFTLTAAPARSGGFAGAGYAGAIEIERSDGVVCENLRVARTGGCGVRAMDATRLRILRCAFHATGGASIATERVEEAEIANCRIQAPGHSTPAAAGMQLLGDRIHVHHNEVAQTPYAGISLQGREALVEFNLVHDAMLVMADGAAFYTSGSNGIVRRNWAEAVGPSDANLAPAYYLDDHTTGYTLEGNVARVESWPLFVHNATGNIVRGNCFLTGSDARVDFHQSRSTFVEGNLFQAGGRIVFYTEDGAIALLRGNYLAPRSGMIEELRYDRNRRVTPLNAARNFVLRPPLQFDAAGVPHFTGDAAAGMPHPLSRAETGPVP
jgi:hypothetical protein